MLSDPQLSRDIPAPPAPDQTASAQMVTRWAYCPRLAWLEAMADDRDEAADPIEAYGMQTLGTPPGAALPAPESACVGETFRTAYHRLRERRRAGRSTAAGGGETALRTRSVTLASRTLGLIAKMDLLEPDADDGSVTLVDFGKGRRAHAAAGAYEPEWMQLCAQALVLEDNGYRVAGAFVWFAESRERVPVALDDALRAATRRAISELRPAAAPTGDAPPHDPAADPALPMYVATPGARVRQDGETLVVESAAGCTVVPIADVSQLVLAGPVSVTTPTLNALRHRRIPVSCASGGGRLLGRSAGMWIGVAEGPRPRAQNPAHATAQLNTAIGARAAPIVSLAAV